MNLPTRLIIWAVFTAAGRDGCGPEFDHGGQESMGVATRTGPLGFIYTRYWLNLQTASNYKAFNQCRGTDTYISPSSGPSCGYILCVCCGWLPLQDWAGQHYRQRAPAAALYLTHQCRPPQQDRIGGVERRGEERRGDDSTSPAGPAAASPAELRPD